jgi:hypothetical protein
VIVRRHSVDEFQRPREQTVGLRLSRARVSLKKVLVVPRFWAVSSAALLITRANAIAIGDAPVAFALFLASC